MGPLGGLISNILAFQASAKATVGMFEWGASASRRVAGYMAKEISRSRLIKNESFRRSSVQFLESDPVGRASRAGKMYAARVMRSVENHPDKHFRAGATAAMHAVRDEALYLPANYMMYRVAKFNARTPEEKEDTASFRRYYFGAPMVMSIGSGLAMNKMGPALKNFAGNKVQKVLSKRLDTYKVREIVRKTNNVAAAGSDFMNRFNAHRMAIKTSVSDKGLLFALGRTKSSWSGFSKSYQEEYSKFYQHYKNRAYDHVSNLQSTIGKYISDSHSEMMNHLEKAKYSSDAARSKYISDRAAHVKDSIYKMVAAHNEYASRPNLFTKAAEFAGVHAEHQYTPLDMKRAILTSGKFKFTDQDFAGLPKVAKRYGAYNVAGKNLNLGSMSFDALSDNIVDSFSKGPVGTVLGMFGLNEAFKSMSARNSLTTMTRHVANADTKLVLGKAFVPSRSSQNVSYNRTMDERSDAYDVAKQMTGLTGIDADDFISSRVAGTSTATGESKYSMFLNHARHGTMMMNQGDLLIMHPGGHLRMESTIGGSGGRRTVTSDISGSTGIKYLGFSSAQSRAAKVMSSALGNSSTNIYDDNGDAIGKYYYGPNPHEGEERVAVGLFGRLAKAIDVGQSDQHSVFSRVMSVFTKHTNPNNTATLFSNLFLENENWRDITARKVRGSFDLCNNLRNARNKASTEFIMRMKQKVGSKNFIKALSELDEHVDVPSDLSYARYLITEGDTFEEAAEKSKSFSDFLYNVRGKDTAISPYDKDISEINHLQSLFPVGKAGYVADISDSTYRGKVKPSTVLGIGRGYRVSAVDEYNGKVMSMVATERRLQGFSDPFDEIMKGNQRYSYGDSENIIRHAVTNSEKSAFIASSHTQEMYHKISTELHKVRAGDLNALEGASGDTIRDHIIHMTGNGNADWKTTKQYFINQDGVASSWLDDADDNLSRHGDQIFAFPGSTKGGGIFRRVPIDLSRGVHSTQGVMNIANMSAMHVARAFNDVLGQIGIGFSDSSFGTLGDVASNIVFKRVLPAGAIFGGYELANHAAKEFLKGTPLGEGFGIAALNTVAGARLGAQGILDSVHATDTTKYLEDLMPGIISSPASGLVRGIGPVVAGLALGRKFGPKGALTGGIIGSAVGALVGGLPLGVFGEWDISKSRNELVDEYTGKEQVAVRKGRWWELGVTPFEGTRIEYYRPSMYALARSDYKHAPGFKDSLITEAIGAVAPDVYAMKNYYSRPYPVTAGLFSNVPIVSNVLNMTGASSLLGGGNEMHSGERGSLEKQFNMAHNSGFSISSLSEMYHNKDGVFSSTSTGSSGGTGGFGPNATAQSSMEYGVGETINQAMDIVGIRGFAASTLANGVLDQNTFFSDAPVLASPTAINGIRSYWDMSLGGLMGMSEGIRRIIPHKRGSIDVFNPLTNTMPRWLPGSDYYMDFRTGDPYTVVPMGEARLPGAGYLLSHGAKLTMPVASEVMGEQVDSQVAYLLGFPEYMSDRNKKAEAIRPLVNEFIDQTRSTGDLMHVNKTAYNAKYDVYSTVDAIVRGDKGQDVAVKFVPKGFAGQSDINAFMVMSGTAEGMLMEVDENGSYNVQRVYQDADRFLEDVRRGKKAGMVASKNMRKFESEGKAMNYGNAFSWLDRLKMLSDVAPYSKETQVARGIVKAQRQAGVLSKEEEEDYFTTLDQVREKQQYMNFSEYRFKDIGDHITEYGKRMDSFYQKEYSQSEQIVGSMWERFSHIKTPLNSKLLHQSSAMEEYERNYIYGKLMPQWEHPINDFLGTYANRMMNTDSIGQSSLSWATGGMLMGGAPLALPMGAVGAVMGGVNSVFGQSLPDNVQRRREVMYQSDVVEYSKYRDMEAQEYHKSYAMKAANTLTAYGVKGMGPDVSKIGQYLGNPESYFVKDIINNMTEDDLRKAQTFLPQPALASLYREMGHAGQSAAVMKDFHNQQMSRYMPDEGASVYSENVSADVPYITTLAQEGLNLHDSGMGWSSQMKNISNLKANGVYGGESLYDGNRQLSGVLSKLDSENAIRNALSSYSTAISMMQDGSDTIEITLIER